MLHRSPEIALLRRRPPVMHRQSRTNGALGLRTMHFSAHRNGRGHHVANRQGGCEHLLGVGQGPAAVMGRPAPWALSRPPAASRADEGRGLLMAVRNAGPQPVASWSPAAGARHLGRGAGLVDEDELGRVEIKLALEPALPPGEHVLPVLFGGVSRFF